MRVDEQARQCISFLAIRKNEISGISTFYPVGTAFFVGVNVGIDRSVKYAVTARHVIDASRPYGSLYIRCVSKSGKKKLFELPQDHWWSHPSTDVSIVPLQIPLEEYDLRFLPTDLFATQDWLKEHDVGVGDRIIIPGMFSQYIGTDRDKPIVRFGRIALTSRELVRIPPQGGLPGMEIEAILAEASAWGGQSGSPVFVYFSVDRGLFAGNELQMRVPNPRLLGLLHGHYAIPQPVIERDTELDEAHVPLNSGIAIVVPADNILELLNSEQAVQNREEYKKILREEGLID